MSKKIKCAMLSFALAAVVAASAAMSACTIKTNHPRAKITVEFNEIEYEIEYTLYRNMYPQTVQHFIELADAGYYDNMIVHDYKTADWFTGAYSYDDDSVTGYATASANNALAEYLEYTTEEDEKNHNKEKEYYDLAETKLTPTVFSQITYDKNGKEIVADEDKLPTLIGEFTSNDHSIEKGALSAVLGTLKMYYYSKGDSNQKVVVENSFGQLLPRDYDYNCATSVFIMQMGSGSSYTATNYCVFAQLRNDKARGVLDDLLDAVSDYIADDLGGSSSKFTTSVTTRVDNLDTYVDEGGREIEVTFTMPTNPIVIKSVKITKY